MLHSRFFRLLAAVVTIALVSVACGGGSDGTAEPGPDSSAGSVSTAPPGTGGGADTNADGSDLETDDPSAAVAGGELRIGVEADPSSLNPTNSPFAPGAILMGTAIFDTLVTFDEEDQWVDNLSESWTPNDDFTSWELRLRPGMTFTDGEPLDADAVLRTVQAQISDPLIGLIFRPVFDPDTPIVKVDDLTLTLTPLGPNSQLPAYFSTQLGMIGSPAWLDAAVDDPSLNQNPVGAGPFVLESRVQDSVTRVVRNDGWWRTDQEIYLDAVEFFPNNQESTRADQLLAGDLEMNHATDADSILRLREDERISRIEDDTGEEFFLIFNTESPPMNDIRVRQAATHAFPLAEYTDLIMRGTNEPAETLFAEGLVWHDADLKQLTDMPELAGPLIEAYCAEVAESCTDGKVDIEYQYNTPSLTLDNIASIIGSAWEPFFNITTDLVPQDNFILEVAAGQFDVSTWRYHGQLDPEVERAFLTCSTVGGISINWSRFCDPDRDILLDQQRATQDEAERVAIWADIQQSIYDAYQYLIISHTNWILGAQEQVRGVCDATTPDGVKVKCFLNGTWRLPQIWLDQ